MCVSSYYSTPLKRGTQIHQDISSIVYFPRQSQYFDSLFRFSVHSLPRFPFFRNSITQLLIHSHSHSSAKSSSGVICSKCEVYLSFQHGIRFAMNENRPSQPNAGELKQLLVPLQTNTVQYMNMNKKSSRLTLCI